MTARRILVPLDQREESESVLPLVAALARSDGATVRCLRVWPIPGPRRDNGGRVVVTADREMERLERLALQDLRRAEGALPGVAVERVVRFGDPVAEILVEAEAWQADLVAMTARRGNWFMTIRAWTAVEVLRRSPVPVILYRLRHPDEARLAVGDLRERRAAAFLGA